MTPYGVNGTLRTPKVEKFRKKIYKIQLLRNNKSEHIFHRTSANRCN